MYILLKKLSISKKILKCVIFGLEFIQLPPKNDYFDYKFIIYGIKNSKFFPKHVSCQFENKGLFIFYRIHFLSPKFLFFAPKNRYIFHIEHVS